jgi:hypothetical protein
LLQQLEEYREQGQDDEGENQQPEKIKMKKFMDNYFNKMKTDTNIEEFEAPTADPEHTKGAGGNKQDALNDNKKNRTKVKSLRPPCDLVEKQKELANPKPVRKTNRETSTVNECPRPVHNAAVAEANPES